MGNPLETLGRNRTLQVLVYVLAWTALGTISASQLVISYALAGEQVGDVEAAIRSYQRALLISLGDHRVEAGAGDPRRHRKAQAKGPPGLHTREKENRW